MKNFKIWEHIRYQEKLIFFIVVIITISSIILYLLFEDMIIKKIKDYDQSQINQNLKTVKSIYNERLNYLLRELKILSYFIVQNINNNDKLNNYLKIVEKESKFHFIGIISLSNNKIISKTAFFKEIPYGLKCCIKKIKKGNSITSTEIISLKYFDNKLKKKLEKIIPIKIIRTEKSSLYIKKSFIKKGMAIICGVPIIDSKNKVVSVLLAGRFLNRDMEFLFRIERALRKGVRITIFQDGVRIATTVPDKKGEPAIGTLVSDEVYKSVIINKKPWLKRAFVVKEWYLSAYWPLFNCKHQPIGIIYVGMPERIFAGFIETFSRKLFLVVALVLIVTCLAEIVITKILSKPVDLILTGINNIKDGKFVVPYLKSPKGDIGKIYNALVKMAKDLQLSQLQEKKRVKMEKELEIAYQIQQQMLSHSTIKNSYISSYAIMVPAQQVGGDFYEIFFKNKKIGLLIGDVSGKGVPAALFMAITRTFFRAFMESDLSLREIIEKVNRLLCQDSKDSMFVTVLFGIYYPSMSKFIFINAGHEKGILYKYKTNEIIYLQAKGRPLGILEESKYEVKIVTIEKNDILIFYTDGILDAINKEEEMFGEERLLECIYKYKDLEPQQMVENIQKEVIEFTEGADQFDDYTLLISKFLI